MQANLLPVTHDQVRHLTFVKCFPPPHTHTARLSLWIVGLHSNDILSKLFSSKLRPQFFHHASGSRFKLSRQPSLQRSSCTIITFFKPHWSLHFHKSKCPHGDPWSCGNTSGIRAEKQIASSNRFHSASIASWVIVSSCSARLKVTYFQPLHCWANQSPSVHLVNNDVQKIVIWSDREVVHGQNPYTDFRYYLQFCTQSRQRKVTAIWSIWLHHIDGPGECQVVVRLELRWKISTEWEQTVGYAELKKRSAKSFLREGNAKWLSKQCSDEESFPTCAFKSTARNHNIKASG